MLMSEVIARSVKYYLKYDLQESIMNVKIESINQARDFQVEQVISWLNRLTGFGSESDSIWMQVSKQAQTSFKTTITRDAVNQGFLVQALQHHCGF